MEQVRMGVIGLGNMGSWYARQLLQQKVDGMTLGAVCDISPERQEWAKTELPGIPVYGEAVDMFESGLIDGVIIAGPHYHHPPQAIEAFQHGLHVLVEKPAGVYTKQVLEMNDVARKSGKVFGIMYNQRTNPVYQKVRELILDGELGNLKRVVWIVTHWYRPQAYHDSGGWRSTWEGEGGGVLINQNPHNLDLLQWVIGMMPARLRSFCHFGKYYDIEVEDDVTAYLEYANGATGVYITSSGEAPGTNRLELSGDMGKIVVENNTITFYRNRISERVHNRINKLPFKAPECWRIEVPVPKPSMEGHLAILHNFAGAILRDEALIAPGEEGIKGLLISNAMHYSTWVDDWAYLDRFDHDKFHQLLQEQIRQSRLRREPKQNGRLN